MQSSRSYANTSSIDMNASNNSSNNNNSHRQLLG
jgi:hypothetical protein